MVNALTFLRHEHVKFPDNLQNVQHNYYQLGHFPGVVGCLDGTHIPIYRPESHSEAEVFRCRKGFFSLNVQIVAGPDHKIFDITARWPGSTHDSRVYSNSSLKSKFENGNLTGILLADSGYPCLR